MGGICDIVFLIDATGSMTPCIEDLKTNIGVFVDGLTEGQSPIRDWRARVIGYRDVIADGSNWFEEFPFVSNDAGALKDQLSRLKAFGGEDEPESLLDALQRLASSGSTERQAMSLDQTRWRHRSDATRIVIVFTDATYHATMSYEPVKGGALLDVQNVLMAEKIILVLYAPDAPCYSDLSSTNKAEWNPIPGPDFVKGLRDFTSDRANFQKALEALAKSVSKSAEVPTL